MASLIGYPLLLYLSVSDKLDYVFLCCLRCEGVYWNFQTQLMQIFVMWLDFVTYLHHHGHEDKLPWYRGKVCKIYFTFCNRVT